MNKEERKLVKKATKLRDTFMASPVLMVYMDAAYELTLRTTPYSCVAVSRVIHKQFLPLTSQANKAGSEAVMRVNELVEEVVDLYIDQYKRECHRVSPPPWWNGARTPANTLSRVEALINMGRACEKAARIAAARAIWRNADNGAAGPRSVLFDPFDTTRSTRTT